MAEYTFLSADLVTGVVRDHVEFDTVRYGAVRNGAAPFRATIRLDATARRTTGLDALLLATEDGDVLVTETGNELAVRESTRRTVSHLIASRLNLDPCRTVIYIERNGTPVGDGIIWDARIEPGSDTLTVWGESLWSYFRQRRITETLTWSGVDHLQLAREVIDWAQSVPGGDIGVVTGDETSGIPRDETVHGWQLTEVADLVERHAARNNGFDFRIRVAKTNGTYQRRFIIGHPGLGRNTNHVWEWGVNLHAFGYEVDGHRTANRFHAVGDGEEEDQLRVTVTDDSLIGPGRYPLLEAVTPHPSVLNLDTLRAHGEAALRARRKPTELPLLHPDPDAIPTLSSYMPGDVVHVRIDRGWVQADGRFTLQAWTVTVDEDGHEELVVMPATAEASGGPT